MSFKGLEIAVHPLSNFFPSGNNGAVRLQDFASASYIAMTVSVSFELIAASYALWARSRPGSNSGFVGRREGFFLI